MQACTRTVSWVRRITLCFFPLDLTKKEASKWLMIQTYFYLVAPKNKNKKKSLAAKTNQFHVISGIKVNFLGISEVICLLLWFIHTWLKRRILPNFRGNHFFTCVNLLWWAFFFYKTEVTGMKGMRQTNSDLHWIWAPILIHIWALRTDSRNAGADATCKHLHKLLCHREHTFMHSIFPVAEQNEHTQT